MKTQHKIEVACDPDVAFAVCLDVAHWPDVFPPCLDAVVLEESAKHQLIGLTAKANNAVLSWESKRIVDRAQRSIEFVQVKASPLVSHMSGCWKVTEAESAAGPVSVISLGHEFEIKAEVRDLVPGVDTPEQALQFMLKSIEKNSGLELAAIRAKLERQLWTHEFSETRLLQRSPRAIYKLLRDAANWATLLPHCNSVTMLYEDPHNQEFEMRVQVGEQEEVIRSIRSLRPGRIDYFQPAPPPALKEHQGYWSTRETDAGVELTSWHAVVLNPAYWGEGGREAAKLSVEAAINRNSLGTMDAIAQMLEEGHHAAA